MKILCACEESQRVTVQLRNLGHEAFSCDIQDCSGGFPEWHIKDDVSLLLRDKWDIIIGFPPCTYLTVAGNRYFKDNPEREQLRHEAFKFALSIYNAPNCDHVCIENPVGYLNSHFRPPDQIINPFDFGEPFKKRTCLWLRGLPCLIPDYRIDGDFPSYVYSKFGVHDRSKLRSKTFEGIASAMAWQFTHNFFVGDLYD